MYGTYEFLLHSNWYHDHWLATDWIKARVINLLRVRRAGAPVWEAARALVRHNAQAKRTLSIFTNSVRKAFVNWPGVRDSDIEKMRQRLLILVQIHHTRPPITITTQELTMVDMVGVYLAVCAKVWDAAARKRQKNKPTPSKFIALLVKAEQSEGLNAAEAQEFLATQNSRNDNSDSVDVEQNAVVEARINKVSHSVAEIDSKCRKRSITDRVLSPVAEISSTCRKRTITDRYVNQQSTGKPATVMRKRSKTSPSQKSPEATERVTCRYTVNEEVMCLKNDEGDGWFHATVIGVHKNNTFNVRFASLPRDLHILHYDPNFFCDD